jgi:hypothetical protein
MQPREQFSKFPSLHYTNSPILQYFVLLPLRIHSRLAVLIESQNFVGLRLTPFHPGGTDGHAGDREAEHRRFLFQQFVEVCGHVAFDNVTFYQRSMASGEAFRHSVLPLEIREGLAKDDLLFDLEAVLFEMARPAVATVSGRRLVNDDRRSGSLCLPVTHDWKQRQAQKYQFSANP